MKTMLKKIYVENFLSLRKVEIGLNTVNILVGKNASGKSNFIKLLRFISGLASIEAIDKIVNILGYKDIRDIAYGKDPTKSIRISIEVILENAHYTYNITIDKTIREELYCNSKLLVRKEDFHVEFLQENEEKYHVESVHYAYTSSLAYLARRHGVHNAIRKFVQYLSSWAFYNFNPAALRSSGDISKSLQLSYDGSNLPQVLHTLLTTRRKVFERIEELLRSMVPEVEELLTPVEDSKVKIAIREKEFNVEFEPENISDGTLRLLALITALALPNPLVTFEEPENCVHPELLSGLMDLVRSSDKQVIITTHSPILLDYVKPEELYLVFKEEGGTKIVRLKDTKDVEKVKEFLKTGGTLGEAWLSGLIGRSS